MTTAPVAGLMPIPPGITPNPTALTSIQLQFIVVAAVLVSLAALAVALRLYTRRCIVRSIGLDDYAAVLSFIVNIGFLAVCLTAMKVGFGRHLWDVPATAIPTYLKLWIPLGITYFWSPALAKLSTLLLFHRLDSAKHFRYFYYPIYAVAFILVSYTIAGTFIVGVGCTPLKEGSQSCAFNFGTAQAILNILTDLLMLLIPIPLLWKLHMPLFQKCAVALIFSIGSLVVVVSIIRLYYNFNFLDQPDFTWYIAKSALLSVIELNCAIVCNCLVVLKPLVNRVLPSLLIYRSGSGSSQHRSWRAWTTRAFRNLTRNESIQLESVAGEEVGSGSGQIIVTKSYHVRGGIEESESTENIVPSGTAGGSTL